MNTEEMYIAPQYPVSAEYEGTGEWSGPRLSYDDYARMSTQVRKQSGERRLPTPRWAIDDTMLRELLVCFMEKRAMYQKDSKTLSVQRTTLSQEQRLAAATNRLRANEAAWKSTLESMCKEYVETKAGAKFHHLRQRIRQLEILIQVADTFLRTTSKDGGLSIAAAVPVLYYRCGLDSVGVGIHLGIKPPHVRKLLFEMHKVAKQLAVTHPAFLEDINAGEIWMASRHHRSHKMPTRSWRTVPAELKALYEYRFRPVELVEDNGNTLRIRTEQGMVLTVDAGAVKITYVNEKRPAVLAGPPHNEACSIQQSTLFPSPAP